MALHSLLLAVLANANAVAMFLHDISVPKPAFGTSFEMGCYYAEDPMGEKGGAKGRSYRGLVSHTESGRECKNWLLDNPWKGANMSATPDLEGANGLMMWGNGLGNHNYCRNPDSTEKKPWCFTLDPHRPIEVCSIDVCTDAQDKDYSSMADELAEKMKPRDCNCVDTEFLQRAHKGQTKNGDPCLCGQS